MSNTLKAGDLVEVRSAAEILASLDENGCLEDLPFMPEMISYIGSRYRVAKRAHKTCDTVHQTGGRRLDNCVHLQDLRCDGAGHDGCKATCLLFWKIDWLKPLSTDSRSRDSGTQENRGDMTALEARLRNAIKSTDPETNDILYRCQATALFDASRPLRWYDLRQYVEDVTSGNVSLRQMLRIWFFHALHKLIGLGIGYGLWVRLYNALQTRVGGFSNPFRSGSIPTGAPTPTSSLDLQPGEQVRVRSYEEILTTLNISNKNRGMRFDPEMAPYCGGVYTVRKRVDRLIHETTGRMIEVKSPSVILDGVVCRSEMSPCRLFCPRAIPSYWREIWLERINSKNPS